MKRRPRFFIPNLRSNKLSAQDSHHLCAALRLKPGALIVVVDQSTNLAYEASIVDPSLGTFDVLARQGTLDQQKYILGTLFFALCKGEKNDLVVEKATELGVSHIVIFEGDRSVVKLDSKTSTNKSKRWEKIAYSAAKQCGRLTVPKIEAATSLSEALSNKSRHLSNDDLCLLCSLAEVAIPLKNLNQPRACVHLLIGPEGDLSLGEHELAQQRGFIPVTLGPLVLRAETAAICALSQATALWGQTET